jgi:TPR repeat protein
MAPFDADRALHSLVSLFKFCVAALALTAGLIFPPESVRAGSGEKRVALVIGNSAYENVPQLENPRKDAAAVAAALRRLGFSEVFERTDLTLAQMFAELRAFGDAAQGADWAVVFFAGHGIQVNGRNYLIPVDAQLRRASHVEDEAAPLQRVLSKVREAKKLRLVMLDACRNNPFAIRMKQSSRKRSLGRGLARIEPDSGELVAYSARDGQEADDGEGEHSPFTGALLRYIEEPGVELNILFRKVRGAVLAATNHNQEPYVYGSLPEELFYFRAPAAPPPRIARPQVAEPSPEEKKRSIAGEIWGTLKDTTSKAQLQRFVEDYGDTPYARFAQARLGELKIQAANAAALECDRLAASPDDDGRRGPGVAFDQIDPAQAAPACQRALLVNAKAPRIMFQFGRALARRGDQAQAHKWFLKAAEAGHAGAMNNLASQFARGKGAPQDYGKAREWYERGAAKGSAFAMTALGGLHRSGHGVPQDYVKAREWFEKAAAKGDATGMFSLGHLYLGGYGVSKNLARAREWFEKAAARGDPRAMTSLGALYGLGQGAPQDFAKAREWYEKAAAKGESRAMFNLGVIYGSGQGVKKDFHKAREWWEKAAAKGEVAAMNNLGSLYVNGDGVARDYVKAHKWFRKAAEKGQPNAMYSLGVQYVRGFGIKRDRAKGRKWLEKARDLGDVDAARTLRELDRKRPRRRRRRR